MKDSTLLHIGQVLAANFTAWTITMAEFNGLLTTLSLTLAIAYTCYKFIKEIKNKK